MHGTFSQTLLILVFSPVSSVQFTRLTFPDFSSVFEVIYYMYFICCTFGIFCVFVFFLKATKFANDFDIKINCGKSVAMRIGKRFKEKCLPLQIDDKDVHVCAGQILKFSVEHHTSKFYRTFKCLYSKSKASNSEMISVELLKSYCFPFYFSPLMLLSSTNIRILENCRPINRALFRIFGSCDKSSLEYICTVC